jgi:hypothetical protein
MSRRLAALHLVCLVCLVGCQDPEILITTKQENGYQGPVNLAVCEPLPLSATDRYGQICNTKPTRLLQDDKDEVAIFFDDPPDPFKVDLILDQEIPESPNQCFQLFLDLDKEPARPVRFTLTFGGGPPTSDCREVCPRGIRACP